MYRIHNVERDVLLHFECLGSSGGDQWTAGNCQNWWVSKAAHSCILILIWIIIATKTFVLAFYLRGAFWREWSIWEQARDSIQVLIVNQPTNNWFAIWISIKYQYDFCTIQIQKTMQWNLLAQVKDFFLISDHCCAQIELNDHLKGLTEFERMFVKTFGWSSIWQLVQNSATPSSVFTKNCTQSKLWPRHIIWNNRNMYVGAEGAVPANLNSSH